MKPKNIDKFIRELELDLIKQKHVIEEISANLESINLSPEYLENYEKESNNLVLKVKGEKPLFMMKRHLFNKVC